MTAWQGYTTAAPSGVHRACEQGPEAEVTGLSASLPTTREPPQAQAQKSPRCMSQKGRKSPVACGHGRAPAKQELWGSTNKSPRAHKDSEPTSRTAW